MEEILYRIRKKEVSWLLSQFRYFFKSGLVPGQPDTSTVPSRKTRFGEGKTGGRWGLFRLYFCVMRCERYSIEGIGEISTLEWENLRINHRQSWHLEAKEGWYAN